MSDKSGDNNEQVVLSPRVTRLILPIVLRALARKEKRLKEEAERERQNDTKSR